MIFRPGVGSTKLNDELMFLNISNMQKGIENFDAFLTHYPSKMGYDLGWNRVTVSVRYSLSR